MIPLSLELQQNTCPQSRGEAGAVFVPGADVNLWLAEAAAWPEAAGSQAKFCVTPWSSRDVRPSGVLILPGSGLLVKPSPRGMPCSEAYPGVWVPRDALLLPALSAADARRLFLGRYHFMHPSIGLVSWEEGDVLEPKHLLKSVTNRRGCSWEMAVAGPEPPPPLKSVKLNIDEKDLSFLHEAGADIGDKSHADFIKTHREAGSLGGVFGRALSLGFTGLFGLIGASMVAAMGLRRKLGLHASKGNRQGQTGSRAKTGKAGFLAFLRHWAKQQTESLLKQRQGELERLMKLLENNPAEGLRFALPLAGDSANRGYADQAGHKLTLRNPSLGNLGRGGSVVDPWNLDNGWRWKLQQRYREIAADEIQQGRFKRAAYIYGELLGDWTNAAGALERAGKHREAARLHLNKTRNRFAAAEALERGGLLAEAAEIFAELKFHERCGDLWTRLGRRAAAFTSYLEALKSAKDRIATARILEQKMQLHSWAVAVLASGWPHSSEAIPCLVAHFQLLSNCRAADELLLQTERLAQHSDLLLHSTTSITAVARLAQDCPYPEVRARLILVGRLAIARRVGIESDERAKQSFLKLLIELEPQDPLLRTDVRRYSTRKLPAMPMPLRKSRKHPIKPARVLEMPRDLRWCAVTGHTGRWLALGVRSGNTTLIYSGNTEGLFAPQSLGRGNPDAAWFVPLPKHDTVDEAGLVTTPALRGEDRLLRCQSETLRLKHMLGGQKPLAVATSGPRSITALVEGADLFMLELATFDLKGHCMRTRALGWAELPAETTSLPFTCVEERAFMALGSQVIMLEDKDDTSDPKLSSANLPDLVTSLVAARPVKNIRVAAAWGREVVLLSPEEKWEPVQLAICGAERPALHFLPDGNLIIASNSEATVMTVEGRTETLATLHYSRPSNDSPVGIVSLDVSTCGILLPDGRMEIFKVEE